MEVQVRLARVGISSYHVRHVCRRTEATTPVPRCQRAPRVQNLAESRGNLAEIRGIVHAEILRNFAEFCGSRRSLRTLAKGDGLQVDVPPRLRTNRSENRARLHERAPSLWTTGSQKPCAALSARAMFADFAQFRRMLRYFRGISRAEIPRSSTEFCGISAVLCMRKHRGILRNSALAAECAKDNGVQVAVPPTVY